MNLIRFSNVTLPGAMAEDDQATDLHPSALVEVLGGAFDGWGSGEGLPGPLTLTKRVLVHDRVDAVLMATLDGLRALTGTRQKLYATQGDESERWRWARLVQLTGTRRAVERGRLEIEMVFECLPGGWRGDAVDETETMASSPHTLTASNTGNRTVRDAVLTVTAGGANITAVAITVTGATHLTWAGMLTAGNALVLNCGVKSIRNDGVDAYAGFALGASHVVDDWLRLGAGDTDIDVAFTGGSTDSTVQIEFDEGWK